MTDVVTSYPRYNNDRFGAYSSRNLLQHFVGLCCSAIGGDSLAPALHVGVLDLPLYTHSRPSQDLDELALTTHTCLLRHECSDVCFG